MAKTSCIYSIASLKACAKRKDLYHGTKIHAEICTSGLLEENLYLGNLVVTMYTKCGAVAKAHEVLNDLDIQDVVCWNAVIGGYAREGQGDEALVCYEEMRRNGLMPDPITYSSVLKACAITQDADKGKQIHDEIVSQGLLGKDIVLGTALITMYAKCMALPKAQQVFDELPLWDLITWNSLIAGYAQQGHGKEALDCYERMRRKWSLFPDAITYTCILNACGTAKEANRGKQFHIEIAKQGLLDKNVVLGNALLDMYAKCGAVDEAQHVFDKLPTRDVISWSAIINGYAQHGQTEEAWCHYEQMLCEGFSPTAITYTCMLNTCGITRDMERGKKIHDEVVDQELLVGNIVLGGALVDMYAKCGAIATAVEVMKELPFADGVSWSALVSGYVQLGQGKEALHCYDSMRREGLSADLVTYVCALKACSIAGDVDRGKQIHLEIATQGLLERDVVLGNALVDMYAKCGEVTRAQRVLEELPARDVASWNALLAGYAQQGYGEEVLHSYELLQDEGLFADAITYNCVLKACSIVKDVERGQQIHNEIVNQGLLGRNVVLGNAVVDMYVKCGAIIKAQEVFDGLLVRDIISWNALIAGYAQQGQGKEALDYYDRMRSEGLSPDTFTYSWALRACSIIREANKGNQVHNEIVRHGLLEGDEVLGNALVEMYAKCGMLSQAEEMIEELQRRHVAAWNLLIGGHTQHGQGEEALECFQHMLSEGISPDAGTYTCVLKACILIGEADQGQQIHNEIVNTGLLDTNATLGTALVDMYTKCNAINKAQELFDGLLVRDTTSWTVLMAGYAQQGQGEEAMKCYEGMQDEGLAPDAITYACILKVCSMMQAIERGRQIHDEITSQGLLQKDALLGYALVDMYAKCGALSKAREVLKDLPLQEVVPCNSLIIGYAQQGLIDEALDCFHGMRKANIIPNDVSWNALIGAYAQQGQAEEAMECFERMQREDIFPDAITFLYILNACSHSGLVDEGQSCFKNMSKSYGITPGIVHLVCMIDLFSRAGHFDQAWVLVKQMPSADHPHVWSALLGGCQRWGNAKLGRQAFKNALQLDECDIVAHVLMANIYAAGCTQEEPSKLFGQS